MMPVGEALVESLVVFVPLVVDVLVVFVVVHHRPCSGLVVAVELGVVVVVLWVVAATVLVAVVVLLFLLLSLLLLMPSL